MRPGEELTRAERPGCLVIAAVEGNHNGDPELARRLIDAAREAGADGVKFQKRTIHLAAVRQVLDRPAPRLASLGASYRKALERIDLAPEILGMLCEYSADLAFHVAPYDVEAFRQLAGVPVSAWHVESALAVHAPLLEAIAASARPSLVSVTGCTPLEMREALALLTGDVTLMHTLKMTPFTAGVLDVATLVGLKTFGRPLGYSDTGFDLSLPLLAIALGATVVEKPLTLDRSLPGPDQARSFLPQELADLVKRVRGLEAILGGETFREPLPTELDEVEWQRVSIVAARSIPRGSRITRDMLALKPPSRGLSPRFLDFLEGRRALYDIGEDDFITFGMIEL